MVQLPVFEFSQGDQIGHFFFFFFWKLGYLWRIFIIFLKRWGSSQNGNILSKQIDYIFT